jgi:hypothetical protein
MLTYSGGTDIHATDICQQRISIINKYIVWLFGCTMPIDQLHKYCWRSVDTYFLWWHEYTYHRDISLEEVNNSYKYILTIELYHNNWAASQRSWTLRWHSLREVSPMSMPLRYVSRGCQSFIPIHSDYLAVLWKLSSFAKIIEAVLTLRFYCGTNLHAVKICC